MKIFCAIILLTLFVSITIAGDSVGKCYEPCSQYSCYDVLAKDFRCPEGLRAIRGWCLGPTNIQCCAPSGTPTGPVYDEEIKTQIVQETLKTCGASITRTNKEISTTPFSRTPAYPCNRYSCYDTFSPNFECPNGLESIRGWCTGPNNIRICGPPGTPIGPYLKTDEGVKMKERILKGEYTYCGPEKEIVNKPNVIQSDFKVIVDGNTDCAYNVENNGKLTRDFTKIECGSEVTIQVGPEGDCRESGECIIWSDGGVFGWLHRVGTYEVSVTKCSLPKEKFICMSTAACRAQGGNPVKGFCSGSVDLQCCVTGEEESADVSFFLKDYSNILTNDNTIEKMISEIYRKKNIFIIVETVNSISSDKIGLVSKKFHEDYQLKNNGIPAFNLIILYGKKENKFLIGHASECGIGNEELESVLKNSDVKSLIQKSDYNNAFVSIIKSLDNFLNSKNIKTLKCGEADAENCAECGKGLSGFIFGCDEDVCEKLGCSFNKKYNLCTDIDVYESTSTISERLSAVKNGFKGFIKKDPLCTGANCAQYVTRVHEYIFGIGKHFITGVGGGAWQIPEFVKKQGGDYKFYDWRNGEIFNEYDSLSPGDILGFHYTLSDYRPLVWHKDPEESAPKRGMDRGNTPDIDFTHVALYLGKRGNEHIITHLYHPPRCQGCDPVRTESLENFLNEFKDKFFIRVVIKPDREKMYRTIPADYKPTFEITTIGKGQKSLNSLVPGNTDIEKEQYMWLTADINSLVENSNLEKYEGRKIRVPQSLPNRYTKDEAEADSPVIIALSKLIQERKDKDNIYLAGITSLDWARAIVKNVPDKSPETIAVVTALIDRESTFNPDPLSDINLFGINIKQGEGIIRPIDIATLNLNTYSVGCMNVQLCKAQTIAKNLQKPSDTSKVYENLKTLDGCIFYGSRMIREIRENLPSDIKSEEDKILIIFADHHQGTFFVRNAILQKKMSDLLKKGLEENYGDKDGDFLSYDKCILKNDITNSEKAVRKLFEINNIQMTANEIRSDLNLEKKKEFENTKVYKEINKLWDDYASYSHADINLDSIKKSNTLKINPSSEIVQLFLPPVVSRTSSIDIKSNINSISANIKYHIITAKILDSRRNEIVPETKKNCGATTSCTLSINVASVDNGIIQYWADIVLTNDQVIREPVSGTEESIISNLYSCDGIYSSFYCMDKNNNQCRNGNYVASYCRGPENIQCCITADKAIPDKKESVAILSIVNDQLTGVLTNPENLCKILSWRVIDSETGEIVKSGPSNQFTINKIGQGDYYAIFYCPVKSDFNTLHPEFMQSIREAFKEKMDVYRYYFDGLKAALQT